MKIWLRDLRRGKWFGRDDTERRAGVLGDGLGIDQSAEMVGGEFVAAV